MTQACQPLGLMDSALRQWIQQRQQRRSDICPQSKALTPEQLKIKELEARINRPEREKAS